MAFAIEYIPEMSRFVVRLSNGANYKFPMPHPDDTKVILGFQRAVEAVAKEAGVPTNVLWDAMLRFDPTVSDLRDYKEEK